MMLTVEQARNKILKAVSALPVERRHISNSQGCILAEDVYANENIPPFRNSAMDGFAVIADDLQGASKDQPATLPIVEVIPAGHAPQQTLKSGQAAKIMTGAMLPEGADSVVMVEVTQSDQQRVQIYESVTKEKNVRFPGESVKTGDLVMSKGKQIRPQEIAMLASLNTGQVDVFRSPVVAVISTGDELTELGQDLDPGKIRDSNRYGICAQVEEAGYQALDLGICRDNEAELEQTLRRGLTKADALVTSGGVSVGEYDIVKSVLSRLGEINFWRVAMKPGKPQAFGLAEGKPIFGLPGNPVSSLTVFDLFVRPALRKMSGHTILNRPIFCAVLQQDVVNNSDRVNYTRAIIEKRDGQYYAQVTGAQGSGILHSLVLANGLITIPPETTVKSGELVELQFFGNAL